MAAKFEFKNGRFIQGSKNMSAAILEFQLCRVIYQIIRLTSEMKVFTRYLTRGADYEKSHFYGIMGRNRCHNLCFGP